MRDAGELPLSVSRETLERLLKYQRLVEKWNPTVNLISKNTLESFWSRHIVDSAQLLLIDASQHKWLDIGSGGGLPGIVVSILLAEKNHKAQVTMIESDHRKCAFLRMVVRELSLNASIVAERVEKLQPYNASVLSARALSSLDTLLQFAHRHLSTTGTAIFPKGASWKNEVDLARKTWAFDLEVTRSVTDERAAILSIQNVQPI